MPDTFENICYKKNFLDRVVVRLDLLAPFAQPGPTLPTALTDKILRRFPIAEPKQAIFQQFQLGLAGQDLKAKRTDMTEWRFFGREREKQLALQPGFAAEANAPFQPGFLWIELKQYRTFELLREEFLEICAAFFEAIPDSPQPSRLGLRYINIFEGVAQDKPLTDWSGFFHHFLLEAFEFPPAEDREAFSRVFHNVELSFDDLSMRFQFGMHNPDHPARMRRKSFVLDYDCYFQGAIDQAGIGSLLDRSHRKIQQYFERSIGDKTREALNA